MESFHLDIDGKEYTATNIKLDLKSNELTFDVSNYELNSHEEVGTEKYYHDGGLDITVTYKKVSTRQSGKLKLKLNTIELSLDDPITKEEVYDKVY